MWFSRSGSTRLWRLKILSKVSCDGGGGGTGLVSGGDEDILKRVQMGLSSFQERRIENSKKAQYRQPPVSVKVKLVVVVQEVQVCLRNFSRGKHDRHLGQGDRQIDLLEESQLCLMQKIIHDAKS